MKRYIPYRFLLVIAALLMQFTLFPAFLESPFRPNLLMFFVVLLGLRHPLKWSAPAAFALGLVEDCYSGIYFGLNAFSYLLIYFILKGMSDRLYTQNRLLVILATFIATLVHGISSLTLLAYFSASAGISSTILPSLLPLACVNAAAAYLLLKVIPRTAGVTE